MSEGLQEQLGPDREGRMRGRLRQQQQMPRSDARPGRSSGPEVAHRRAPGILRDGRRRRSRCRPAAHASHRYGHEPGTARGRRGLEHGRSGHGRVSGSACGARTGGSDDQVVRKWWGWPAGEAEALLRRRPASRAAEFYSGDPHRALRSASARLYRSHSALNSPGDRVRTSHCGTGGAGGPS